MKQFLLLIAVTFMLVSCSSKSADKAKEVVKTKVRLVDSRELSIVYLDTMYQVGDTAIYYSTMYGDTKVIVLSR